MAKQPWTAERQALVNMQYQRYVSPTIQRAMLCFARAGSQLTPQRSFPPCRYRQENPCILNQIGLYFQRRPTLLPYLIFGGIGVGWVCAVRLLRDMCVHEGVVLLAHALVALDLFLYWALTLVQPGFVTPGVSAGAAASTAELSLSIPPWLQQQASGSSFPSTPSGAAIGSGSGGGSTPGAGPVPVGLGPALLGRLSAPADPACPALSAPASPLPRGPSPWEVGAPRGTPQVQQQQQQQQVPSPLLIPAGATSSSSSSLSAAVVGAGGSHSRATYCGKCAHPRPPRARHCSTCGRCVALRDHHCLWLGTCLGQRNLPLFLQFTLLTALLSAALLALTLYYYFLQPPLALPPGVRPDYGVPSASASAAAAGRAGDQGHPLSPLAVVWNTLTHLFSLAPPPAVGPSPAALAASAGARAGAGEGSASPATSSFLTAVMAARSPVLRELREAHRAYVAARINVLEFFPAFLLSAGGLYAAGTMLGRALFALTRNVTFLEESAAVELVAAATAAASADAKEASLVDALEGGQGGGHGAGNGVPGGVGNGLRIPDAGGVMRRSLSATSLAGADGSHGAIPPPSSAAAPAAASISSTSASASASTALSASASTALSASTAATLALPPADAAATVAAAKALLASLREPLTVGLAVANARTMLGAWPGPTWRLLLLALAPPVTLVAEDLAAADGLCGTRGELADIGILCSGGLGGAGTGAGAGAGAQGGGCLGRLAATLGGPALAVRLGLRNHHNLHVSTAASVAGGAQAPPQPGRAGVVAAIRAAAARMTGTLTGSGRSSLATAQSPYLSGGV